MFSGIGGFELGIQQATGKPYIECFDCGQGGHMCEVKTIESGSYACCENEGYLLNAKDYPIEYISDWECVGYSEIDKYAIQIYNSHFNHKNYGDATTINTNDLPNFDLLVGGFPCQAFSVAGKRKGFDDTRGTLFFEIARILRDKRPRYLVLENVKGLLSHDSGKTFQTILGVLSDLGYTVEWQVLNSKNFGVPQNRERVFIIGYIRGERRPKVFPIRRITEQTLNFLGGAETKRWLEDDKSFSRNFPQGSRVYGVDGISATLASNAGGLGAKTGLYCINTRSRTDEIYYEKSPTITASMHKEMLKVAIPVLTPDRENKRQNGRRFKEDGEPAFTLTGQDKHGIYDGYRIRRLTPIECERLQGFPDNWTGGLSDTQRYKCLGNAVTVNVINYIFNNFI